MRATAEERDIIPLLFLTPNTKETPMVVKNKETRNMIYRYLEFWMMFSIYVNDEKTYTRHKEEVRDYYEEDQDINILIKSAENAIINSSRFSYFMRIAKGVENLHIPYLKYSCNPYA